LKETKELLLLSELRDNCGKIGFDPETAVRELKELIEGLKVIDYYITIEVPSEHFVGTLMDSLVLTDKIMLGYEVKSGNISLVHRFPLNRVALMTEEIIEEKGEKYIIAHFYWGSLGSLGTSAMLGNRERLRKFIIRASKYIFEGEQ